MIHSEKTALVVDTDMGLDDVRAILALLADSTLDIKGILTVEFLIMNRYLCKT